MIKSVGKILFSNKFKSFKGKIGIDLSVGKLTHIPHVAPRDAGGLTWFDLRQNDIWCFCSLIRNEKSNIFLTIKF